MPFFSGIIAGATLLGTLVNVGVSLAVSYGISYLQKKKLGQQKKSVYAAVSGEVKVGGGQPIELAFGEVATAGYRAYYAKYGAGNKYNTDVYSFSIGWCDGLEPYVFINGEKKALIAKSAIGGEIAHYDIEDYIGLFSIRFYDGRPGQIADAKLVSDTASLGNNWKSTSRFTNTCYVVVERLYDEKFDGRHPEMLWVLRGVRCYDPRKDSTFPGGSGGHRQGDPSTWEFTLNPAIHRLNYQLGFKGPRSGVSLIGMGKPISSLDTGSYIASANVCDTTRNVDGTNYATYECNLIVNSDSDHSEVISVFDDAMAGYALNRSGLAGVLAGAPQVPAGTITVDDLRIDGPRSSQYKRSAFEQVNYLSGQFTSIESMFQPESLDPLTSSSDVTNDGRIRNAVNDFLQVTNPVIAQYLLTIRYRQNRLGAREVLPVSARAWFYYETGDWVSFEDRTWLIVKKDGGNLTLAETSGDVYAEGGIQPGPILIPPNSPINPSLLTTVANFKAEAGLIGDPSHNLRPVLEFGWDAPNDPTIVAVYVQYRRVGSTEISDAISGQPNSGQMIVDQNILGLAFYECRATIRTVPDRRTTWTPWITTSQPMNVATVLFRQWQKEARELIEGFRTDIDGVDITKVESVMASSLEHASSAFKQRVNKKAGEKAFAQIEQESITREAEDDALADEDEALAADIEIVQSGVDDNTAQIISETIARVTKDNALASDITTVQATANGAAAAVITQATASVSRDDALAESISATQVTLDDVTATSLVKHIASVGPAGANSKISLVTRLSTSTSYKLAGMAIETYSTGGGNYDSRMVFEADKFLFSDGSGNADQLFAIVSGGAVYSGKISSFDGKRVIDANGDTFIYLEN